MGVISSRLDLDEGGAMGGRVERLIQSTLGHVSPQAMLLDVVCFAGRQKEVE